MKKRILMLKQICLFLLMSASAFTQQGFYLINIPSSQGDKLFNAAGETSNSIDLLKSGTKEVFTHKMAVQAFASAGTTACTYSVKGSTHLASTPPVTTDFVFLSTPTILSCLTTSDERLHFYQTALVGSILITLETLTGGTGVTFNAVGTSR